MTGLRIDHVSVSFDGRSIVRDISFALKPGELVGLIGPNGAGKSTLLKAIAGLVPHQGTVKIDAVDLDTISASERAARISYLPQDRDLAWPLTVENLVALGRTPYRAPMRELSSEDRRQIDLALQRTDTEYLRSRSAMELSGGERARVLAARALAQATPALLADEPNAGLDPAHQIGLMEVFADMARDGRIILISLHDLSLAARWCGRLILLDAGAVVANGPPDAVLTEENLAKVYGVTAHIVATPGGFLVQPVARIATRAS